MRTATKISIATVVATLVTACGGAWEEIDSVEQAIDVSCEPGMPLCAFPGQTNCCPSSQPIVPIDDEDDEPIATAPHCGNNVKDHLEEQCDGVDLAEKTCTSLGYIGGNLGCNTDCHFDRSGCYSICGDGKKTAGELCDGLDLDGKTCATFGYDGGTLRCNASCGFDASGCGTTHTLHGLKTPKLIPPWTGQGDRDFSGNGPMVAVSVRLRAVGNELWADVYMLAVESTGDRTKAEGSASYKIYTNNGPILRILNQTTYDVGSYTDQNQSYILNTFLTVYKDDYIFRHDNDLVKYFLCTGDSAGDDAGIKTGVTVYFDDISFVS